MTDLNPQTLKRFVDQHWPALVLYARQWCDDPEDAVQEALLKLAGQRPWPDDPIAWTYRVLKRQAVSHRRSAGRRRAREHRACRDQAWVDSVDDRLDAQQLTEALSSLDSDTREIIVTRIWGGLNFRQISELSGLSISTVFRRYEHGLTTLRDQIAIGCKHEP